MIIFGSVDVRTITLLAILISWASIITCYVLAVSLGHVPAWLPTISDCAVGAPEKYLFRIGLITGATALFANVVMVYYAFPKFVLRKLELVAGVAAAAGLTVVGAVNEKENNTVHIGGTIALFLGYETYMVALAQDASKDSKISSTSVISKHIFAIVGIVLLLAAGIFCTDWKKYRVYVALCEWLYVFNIEIFNLTLFEDLQGLLLLEVQQDELISDSVHPDDKTPVVCDKTLFET